MKFSLPCSGCSNLARKARAKQALRFLGVLSGNGGKIITSKKPQRKTAKKIAI